MIIKIISMEFEKIQNIADYFFIGLIIEFIWYFAKKKTTLRILSAMKNKK